MIQFNIGNLVFIRSNCEYNTNVATGERVLLIPGKYSCEKDEMNTTLVCIMKPFKKTVLVNKYGPFGYTHEYKEKMMMRVMSTATHKVYDVDPEWCDLIPNKKAYDEVRYFTLLDNALNDEFLDMSTQMILNILIKVIKFRKHNKQNDLEYIRYSNLILPIKVIVYIEQNTRRTFDSVMPDILYNR